MSPRNTFAERSLVGREHYLSKNATQRHDLTIFSGHSRERVDLKKSASWGPA